MEEVREASHADAGSTLRQMMSNKVSEEVVEFARFDGNWLSKIKFEESAIPSSLFILKDRESQLALASSECTRIVWEEQWMQDIPEDLFELASTLETMIDASEDVSWSPESSSYVVGDNRRMHLCLERACIDSKGTQCPKLAISTISQQLVDRVSRNDDGRAEKIDAIQYLGKLVQDTYNSHLSDPGRMTAEILALVSSDNPFRRLMRA